MKKRLVVLLIASTALLAGVACEGDKKPSAKPADYQRREQQVTSEYQTRLSEAVPYPLEGMKDSLERRQLRERLLRFNKPDKIAYINLLASTGQVITSIPIKGKVSSVNSGMTTSDQVQWTCRTSHGCSPVVLDSPTDDGSYGTNGDAIFFFTTENVYVEWNGPYILTDAPLKVSSAPLVIYDPSSKPSSTAGG